jgi:hypothetical protein
MAVKDAAIFRCSEAFSAILSSGSRGPRHRARGHREWITKTPPFPEAAARYFINSESVLALFGDGGILYL